MFKILTFLLDFNVDHILIMSPRRARGKGIRPTVQSPEEAAPAAPSRGESQEEGEYRVGAASPGGMETEETSFVQQMQDVLKEGPADVPPTPDVDPSAADTVKLKEAGTSSGALESAPTNEGKINCLFEQIRLNLCVIYDSTHFVDVTMHESVGGETTHTTEVEEFNEHHLDFNLSEGDHEYISDLLSGKTPGAATESNVGVGPTEAGPSERPVAGTDTTIIIGTSDRLESSELVPWTRTEVDLQSSVLEPQPSTPMDPMMIEVTVTPQISPVATKARPTEEVGTSADVVTRIESPLKESLSLDPPSSETLVEKVPDVAGASTATIPEPILTVQESRLSSLSEPSHAEGSSVEFVPSSLSTQIQALLVDDDPDKSVICSNLQGFISFLNSMVDRILFKRSYFENYKKSFERFISGFREEGYNDLADSVTAYLVDLRQHIELLQTLRTKGVPFYIASHMESRLQAWRNSQESANSELQQLRAHSHQLRVNIGKRTQAKVNLRRDIKSSRAEIARLEEELAMAKDALDVLESELTQEIHVEEDLLQQLNFQDKIIAEKEQEVAALQSVDEEAFKIKLTAELEQTYALELSKLENQISQYKLL
ncbi:golgin subfamily A member 5-like isoform X3 [Asparagus officinalis]|uniref:golgin subfamily A member 5-like isoform X4 n=1 Tax=Asparagus officinalis TaxID=4686 RepID=UPI00098E1A68|nr:golgin subfamily A member 5-like isoform X4 [Asparagus officinalis]XP_020260894.1 golgin subfamily A member 5-like isoform X3 [Asparagus officinalis]XP_020276408.1 golgin subfamily A member 5-like isoform X3 [Asparagus officinalis]